MKPLKQVGQSYQALAEGDRFLLESRFEEALASFQRAMEVTRTIPAEEAFDHAGFDAIAQTGRSEALVGLGRFQDALASIDVAQHYFNRRGELNQEEGVKWIEVVCSKAVALEGVGRTADALGAAKMAAEMIGERKAEYRDRASRLASLSDQIARLESKQEPATRRAGYKAWWEFWA